MDFLGNILSALGSAGTNVAQAAAPIVQQTIPEATKVAGDAITAAGKAAQAGVTEGKKFKLSQLPNMFMDFMNTKQAQWEEEQRLQRAAKINQLKQLAGVDVPQQAQPLFSNPQQPQQPQPAASQMQVQIPAVVRNSAVPQFNWSNGNQLFKL